MKYIVEVDITNRKELTIYASSEDEAEEKATDLVMGWANVDDVEIVSVDEA